MSKEGLIILLFHNSIIKPPEELILSLTLAWFTSPLVYIYIMCVSCRNQDPVVCHSYGI